MNTDRIPIILLHGGPALFGYMHSLTPFLGDNTVVTYAQPGSKENPSVDSGLSIQYEELTRQIKQTGASEAILIGHSWGANLGLLYASKYPEQVRKIILIGTAPLQEDLETGMINNIHSRLSPTEAQKIKNIDAEISKAIEKEDFAAVEEILQSKNKLVWPTYHYDSQVSELLPEPSFSLQGFLQQKEELWQLVTSGEIETILKNITIPVDIFHGKEDVIPCFPTLEFLSPLLPQANLHIISQAGHFPWLEPKAFSQFAKHIQASIE